MADIRINALATTATTPASDDYLALDGTAQGTRKILATNIANNVTDVILGASGPSVKSTLSARAPRQGLVFDGTAGTTVVNVPAFGTGDFTVAAWVSPVATASTQYIFSGGSTAFGLRLLNGGTIQTTKMGTADNTASSGTLTAGKTALVVYTRSGTTGTYYINGVATGTTTDSQDYPVAVSVIGKHGFASQDYWTGSILTPIAENRALSASEVVALYEAGAPAGADYNQGNSVVTGAWTASGSGTVTSTAVTNFNATATGALNVVSAQTVAVKSGTRVRLSGSFSSITGSPTVFLYSGGLKSDQVALTSTGATITATASGSFDLLINFGGAGTAIGASVSVDRLGLLLAPDAAQAGGGLVWYDTSGNAANITLPASGVSWNVPSSRVLGGNWTTSGTLSATGSQTADTVPYNLLAGGNKRIYIGYNTTGDYGAINVADTGVAWKNLLLNQNGGNVLIGTVIDGGQKLQVSGTAAISGNLTVSGGTVDNSPASGGPLFRTIRPANTGSAAFASIPNGALSASNVEWYSGLIGSSGDYKIWAYNGSTNTFALAFTPTGDATFAKQIYLNTSSPPPWDPLSFNVMVAGSNAFGGTNTGSNNLIVASNTYFNGSVFKYATTGYATAYRQLVGAHFFYVATSGTAGDTASFSTALSVLQGGTIQFNQYGAGTLTTDSSGTITATSDERAKNITGTFTKGLAEVIKLTPKTYTWKPETGLNTTDVVSSLTAQDLIAAGIPEAVSTYRTVADLNDDGTPKLDANGKQLTKRIEATYTVSDRAVIAALVNAVKELNAKVAALESV